VFALWLNAHGSGISWKQTRKPRVRSRLLQIMQNDPEIPSAHLQSFELSTGTRYWKRSCQDCMTPYSAKTKTLVNLSHANTLRALWVDVGEWRLVESMASITRFFRK